jgi:hypothetical protein
MRCDPLKVSISCLSLLAVLFELGCSQLQVQPEVPTPTPTPTALSVTISPQSLVMKHGGSWNFDAGRHKRKQHNGELEHSGGLDGWSNK